jgi:hypothetical protein
VSNLIFHLNAQYKGYPPTTATLKQSLEIKCEYTGSDDNGEFNGWFKDDIPISSEKAGHYVVRQTAKESILVIKIFGKEKNSF